MSPSANQKSNNPAWKTPLIIIGVFVCLTGIFTITGLPYIPSLQKVHGFMGNVQVNARPAAIAKLNSVEIHGKSSKPHYDFLSYYFMVESDRKKPSERTFHEGSGMGRRFAMLPKLLFNSFFAQN